MRQKRIPKAPWSNGIPQDGDYDAIVHPIERCAYGKDNVFYFRIVLWLMQPQRFIATNIYVRDDLSRIARQRIWHFCQAYGTSNDDLCHRSHEFCAKHIRFRDTFEQIPASIGDLSIR